MARELIEHFGMDRVDWCHVLWRAEQLARRQDFRRLVVRIADELERVELPARRRSQGPDGSRPRGQRGMTAKLEHKPVEATTRVADAQPRGAGAGQATDEGRLLRQPHGFDLLDHVPGNRGCGRVQSLQRSERASKADG